MRRYWIRLIAVLAALVVVVAACSSDRDEPATTADDTETTEASDEGGDGIPTDSFGTLDTPCGEGDGGPAGDQGVTEDQIVIGYGDDAGFPTSPGLSHETSDAIEAMIAWCNDQGGINGREIVGNYYDAAITNVTNAMTQACAEVFMLVGEAWALDSAQEETRVGCGLPAVPTYSVSPEFANGPLVVQPVPNPADIYTAGWAGQIAELFPEEVKNASVMYGNFAATIDTKDKVVQTFDDFGFEFLDCPIEYNIAGEADWKPFAQRLKRLRRRGRLLLGPALPEHAEPARRRSPGRLLADLARRPQRLPAVVRRVERDRQRRQRLPAHGLLPVRAGRRRARPPAVHRHRRGQRRRHQPPRRRSRRRPSSCGPPPPTPAAPS